ncbi:hypothetical protein B224_3943 [Aeromonas media WS]|nr:hypothetical protein B224_3943 [Aeromonas media WS]
MERPADPGAGLPAVATALVGAGLGYLLRQLAGEQPCRLRPGRGLLGLYRESSGTISLRLLSGRSVLAHQSGLRRSGRAAGAADLAAHPAQGLAGALYPAGVPCHRLRADPRRCRSRGGGNQPLGRPDADPGAGGGGHRGRPAIRDPAGIGTPLPHAGHLQPLHRLYRVLAGGAAHHCALHGLGHAAAVHDQRGGARQAAEGAHRHHSVPGGLCGRGGEGGAAGDPQGAVRGGGGAGALLLEGDGAGHHAPARIQLRSAIPD